MLSNTITVADSAAVNHNFDLISREGMNSVRREAGESSNEERLLEIKNTISFNSNATINKHLVRLGMREIGVDGVIYPISAHAVISRHKSATDAEVLERAYLLGTLLQDSTFVNEVLIGGN